MMSDVDAGMTGVSTEGWPWKEEQGERVAKHFIFVGKQSIVIGGTMGTFQSRIWKCSLFKINISKK